MVRAESYMVPSARRVIFSPQSMDVVSQKLKSEHESF